MWSADINVDQHAAAVQLGNPRQEQQQEWWPGGTFQTDQQLAGTITAAAQSYGGAPAAPAAAGRGPGVSMCAAQPVMPTGPPAMVALPRGEARPYTHSYQLPQQHWEQPPAACHELTAGSGMAGGRYARAEAAGGSSAPTVGPVSLGGPSGGRSCGALTAAEPSSHLQFPTQRTLSWSEAQRLLSRWDSGASTADVALGGLGVSPTHQQQLLQALQQQDTSPLLLPLQLRATVPSTLAAAGGDDSVEAEGCSSGRSSTDGSHRVRPRGGQAASTRRRAQRQGQSLRRKHASPPTAAAAAAPPAAHVVDGGAPLTFGSAAAAGAGAVVTNRLSHLHALQPQEQQQGGAVLRSWPMRPPRRTSSHSSQLSVSSCSSGSEEEEEEREGMGSTCGSPRSQPHHQPPEQACGMGLEVEGQGQGRPSEDPLPLRDTEAVGSSGQDAPAAAAAAAAMLPTHRSPPHVPAAGGVTAGHCATDAAGVPAAALLQQQAEQLQALLLQLAAAAEVLGLGRTSLPADFGGVAPVSDACRDVPGPRTEQDQRPHEGSRQTPRAQQLGAGRAVSPAAARAGASLTYLDQQQQQQQQLVAGSMAQWPAGHTLGAAGLPLAQPGATLRSCEDAQDMIHDAPAGVGRPQLLGTGHGTHSPAALGASSPPATVPAKKRAMASQQAAAGGQQLLQLPLQPQQQRSHLGGAGTLCQHTCTPSPTAGDGGGGPPPCSDTVHRVLQEAVLREQRAAAAAQAGAGADLPAAGGVAEGPDLAARISRMLEEEVTNQQRLAIGPPLRHA